MDREHPEKQFDAANTNKSDTAPIVRPKTNLSGNTAGSHEDNVKQEGRQDSPETRCPSALSGGPDRTFGCSRKAESLNDTTSVADGLNLPRLVSPETHDPKGCSISEPETDTVSDDKHQYTERYAEASVKTRPAGISSFISGGKKSEPPLVPANKELPAESFKNAVQGAPSSDEHSRFLQKLPQEVLEYGIDPKETQTHHLEDRQVISSGRCGQCDGDDGKSHSPITTADDEQRQKQVGNDGSETSDDNKMGNDDTHQASEDDKEYLDEKKLAPNNTWTTAGRSADYAEKNTTNIKYYNITYRNEHKHLNYSKTVVKFYIDLITDDAVAGNVKQIQVSAPPSSSDCNTQPGMNYQHQNSVGHLSKHHQDKRNHPATIYLHQRDVETSHHDEDAYLRLYQNEKSEADRTGENPSDARHHGENTAVSQCKIDDSPLDERDHIGQSNSPTEGGACSSLRENDNCNNEAAGQKEHRHVSHAIQHPCDGKSASDNCFQEREINTASFDRVENTEVNRIADDNCNERGEDSCPADHKDLPLHAARDTEVGVTARHGDGLTGEETDSCRNDLQLTDCEGTTHIATGHAENMTIVHDGDSFTGDKDVSFFTADEVFDTDEVRVDTDGIQENRDEPFDSDDISSEIMPDDRLDTEDRGFSHCDGLKANTGSVKFNVESHSDDGHISHNDGQRTTETQSFGDFRGQDAQQIFQSHAQSIRNNHNAMVSVSAHAVDTQHSCLPRQCEPKQRQQTTIDVSGLEQCGAPNTMGKYKDVSLHEHELHQNSLDETEPSAIHQPATEDSDLDVSLILHKEERQYRKPGLFTWSSDTFVHLRTPLEDAERKGSFPFDVCSEQDCETDNKVNVEIGRYKTGCASGYRVHKDRSLTDTFRSSWQRTGAYLSWRADLSFANNPIVFPFQGQGFDPDRPNPSSGDEGRGGGGGGGRGAEGRNGDVHPEEEAVESGAHRRHQQQPPGRRAAGSGDRDRDGVQAAPISPAQRRGVVRHDPRGHRQMPPRPSDSSLLPCVQCLLVRTRVHVGE